MSKVYSFRLVGTRQILFHQDDVMASDMLEAYRKDPANRSISTPGDDRSPAWTWQIYLYHDGRNLVIPQENIMAMIRKAASLIPVPKGKGTFKNISQSSLLIDSPNCVFLNKTKQVPIGSIVGLRDLSFKEQFDAVKKLGFELKVKRAAVGQKKHVRVRAMFTNWAVTGNIEILDDIVTRDVLASMFRIGGRYVGLLDWRPGSPKSPGPYGMFESEIRPA